MSVSGAALLPCLVTLADTSCVQDNILMPIRGEGQGLTEEGQAESSRSAESERLVYVLHPNCAVEEV